MSDRISPPTDEDLTWLMQAEAHLLRLLQHRYGEVALEHSAADLEIAQQLIDDRGVPPENELDLQCLGVLLGNVFAANTSMRWTRVENEFGDMLALHSNQINFTLYPLTMISKRVQDQREMDIPALYRSLVQDLDLSKI